MRHQFTLKTSEGNTIKVRLVKPRKGPESVVTFSVTTLSQFFCLHRWRKYQGKITCAVGLTEDLKKLP